MMVGTEAVSLCETAYRAVFDGIIEVECIHCGDLIICEPDAVTAWCEICGKMVKVRNMLIELGLI